MELRGYTTLIHKKLFFNLQIKIKKIQSVSIAKDASFVVHAFGSKFKFANTTITERFRDWDGMQRNFSTPVPPSPAAIERT